MNVNDTRSPDITKINDYLYIGDLSAALNLHRHTHLGITHILSVCPNYPERPQLHADYSHEGPLDLPQHLCIPVIDSEYEDILLHLPLAIKFISDALDHNNSSTTQGDVVFRRRRVLVHCVMGISRSVTVVCAYLMATFDLSPTQALFYIRQRRPHAHPNYGFRRQLEVFAQMKCLKDYPAPLQTHPLYIAWQRRQKRDAKRFLSRLEDVVSVPLDKFGGPDAQVAVVDEFPTDATEASSLLCEIEVTHFLSLSPATLPKLSSHLVKLSPPLLLYPPLSTTSSTSTRNSDCSGPSSATSSPMSSRSSSFSMYSLATSSRTSSSSVAPSTYVPSAGHSALKTCDNSTTFPRGPIDLSKVNERVMVNDIAADPDYLQLSGVQYLHVDFPSESCPDDDGNFDNYFICLEKAEAFIAQAIMTNSGNRAARSKVLIHCTTESRAYLALCAYLVGSRREKRLGPNEAIKLLENALPLFSPTTSFRHQLEMFASRNFESASANTDLTERRSPICEKRNPDFDIANLEELLARCAGVGHPGFSFDAEAFRGALSTHQKARGQT